jgi:hypothetical protein
LNLVEELPFPYQSTDPAQLTHSRRSHESLPYAQFAVPLSAGRVLVGLYVCGAWEGTEQLGQRVDLRLQKGWLQPHTDRQVLTFISFFSVAQQMHCHLGTSVTIESKPSNWTTEKVETCDNGSLCQETILLIKSGKRRIGQLS